MTAIPCRKTAVLGTGRDGGRQMWLDGSEISESCADHVTVHLYPLPTRLLHFFLPTIVWLDPQEAAEIGQANSRSGVRKLLKDGHM